MLPPKETIRVKVPGALIGSGGGASAAYAGLGGALPGGARLETREARQVALVAVLVYAREKPPFNSQLHSG